MINVKEKLPKSYAERLAFTRNLMKNHDWWYDWADDRRSWGRGRRERDAIVEALDSLTEQDADNLWAEQAPPMYREWYKNTSRRHYKPNQTEGN